MIDEFSLLFDCNFISSLALESEAAMCKWGWMYGPVWQSSISMNFFGAGRLAPEIFRAGGGVGHQATCVDQWPAFS